jgi:hypothetical protein
MAKNLHQLSGRPEINAVISARILAFMVNGGMSVREAFNQVLGPAQYECLVEELYHELRGEAA